MSYNTFKTGMLMALLLAIVVVAFGFVGGRGFAFFGLIIGILINFTVYWKSDSIVLSMTGAKEVTPEQAPVLHGMVERLSRRAGIPKPKVCVVKDQSLNAFATGRDPAHAAVAVHTGLLQKLTDEEIEGVLAHELSHIKNRDTLIQTVAAVMAGTLSYLYLAFYLGGGRRGRNNGLALLALILAPLAAMLVQMAISRGREYAADAGGGRLADPGYLASALGKISHSIKAGPPRQGNPATSHMYIMNPFKGSFVSNLFSTHPPAEERIRRLEEMR